MRSDVMCDIFYASEFLNMFSCDRHHDAMKGVAYDLAAFELYEKLHSQSL
jgi:hypothetical protein